jgi:hypothetical protein
MPIFIFNLFAQNEDFPITLDEAHPLSLKCDIANESWTIAQLKSFLNDVLSISTSVQRLVYLTNCTARNSRCPPLTELSVDDRKLVEYGILNHAWLVLKERKRVHVDHPVQIDTEEKCDENEFTGNHMEWENQLQHESDASCIE